MHNTGNELASNDILDFSDNCVNLDTLMNSDEGYWVDRFNNKKPTIDYALRMAGFTPAGFDFTTGGVLKNGDRNKCVFNQADQTWYSWSGDLPYNVIAGSTPGEGWKVVNRTIVIKYKNFTDALNGSDPVNTTIETISFHTGSQTGGARYTVVDTVNGKNKYRCFPRTDGKFLYISPLDGVVTIEQLGGHGSITDGSLPIDDSWEAFYRAFQIKRENWLEPVEFKATMRTYKISKPLLMYQGMSLKSSHILGTFIYYEGYTVTADDVAPVKELGGNVIDYTAVQAEVIFVQPPEQYCKYSKLFGFDFSSTGGAMLNFGLYHRYLNRSKVESCRFKNVKIGQFGIDVYTNKFEDLVFTGHDSIPSDSIMSQIYPRGGYNEVTVGSGTSNIWERCGGSNFRKTWEHVNHHYSIFNGCYSETGTDIVMNMIRCKGIVFNAYGVENMVNVTPNAFRFNGSSVVINGLDFAYKNHTIPDALFLISNAGTLQLSGINFTDINTSGGAVKLTYIDPTSKLVADGIKLPTNFGVGVVEGLLSLDTQVSSSGVKITNSSGTEAVTETFNSAKYVHKGKMISLSIEISWSAAQISGDLYISSLPYPSERSISVTGLSVGLPAGTVFSCASSSNKLIAVNGSTGVGVPIPSTGRVLLNFSYQRS